MAGEKKKANCQTGKRAEPPHSPPAAPDNSRRRTTQDERPAKPHVASARPYYLHRYLYTASLNKSTPRATAPPRPHKPASSAHKHQLLEFVFRSSQLYLSTIVHFSKRLSLNSSRTSNQT